MNNLLGEIDEFTQKHSNVRVLPLATHFYFCQGRRAKSLEEAYDHVYGGLGCPWCRELMKREREMHN